MCGLGWDAKTVARYVTVREAGGDPLAVAAWPRLIDRFLDKIEERVDRSEGKIGRTSRTASSPRWATGNRSDRPGGRSRRWSIPGAGAL
jgi:hypothetical protein